MESKALQDVVDVIGKFGIYHGLVLSVAVLRAIPTAWTYMMSPLMAPEVPHRCSAPDHVNESEWIAFAKPDECSAFPLASIFNGTAFRAAAPATARLPCEFGWHYNTSQFGPTATSEWNLVCSSAWMRSGLQAMIMAGSVCGVLVFGKLADCFGRKRAFCTGIPVAVLVGVAGVFADSLWLFNAARFILSGCTAGTTAAIVTLFMEIMPNTDRVLMNVGFGVGYVVPIIFIGLLSWALRSFRLMQLSLGLSFLLVIPFFPFIEESPKWLLANGRTEEATRAIRRILRRSRRSVPDLQKTVHRLAAQFEDSKAKKPSIPSMAGLLYRRTTRLNLVCIFALWFCESLTYYNISLNAHRFSVNPQLSYAISASAEIPAALIGIWVCRRFGRRPSQMLPVLLGMASFALLLGFGSSTGPTWLNLVAMMWIRFLLKSQNFTQWIAVHENFPTPLRSTGFAVCNMFARTGGAVAPFLIDLGRETHPAVPHAVFFIAAIVECLCLRQLPETLGVPLPDTVEALEAICSKDGGPTSSEQSERKTAALDLPLIETRTA